MKQSFKIPINISAKFSVKFMKEYLVKHGVTHMLAETMNNSQQSSNQEFTSSVDQLCQACNYGTGIIFMLYQNSSISKAFIMETAINLCGKMNFGSSAFCNGLVNIFFDTVYYLLQNKPDLTTTKFCGLLLFGQCGDFPAELDFTVQLSGGSPVTVGE